MHGRVAKLEKEYKMITMMDFVVVGHNKRRSTFEAAHEARFIVIVLENILRAIRFATC